MGYLSDATAELYGCMPPLTKKDDFDAFWQETIVAARQVPLSPVRSRIEYPIENVEVYDIRYFGMDGTPIHGAFRCAAEYAKRHPDELDLVLDTLSYFDTMNMADRITCRVLASVALKDETCPPKMFFATYNRIAGAKDIVVYPFNGHEGGGGKQTEKKLAYVIRWLGS